MTREVGFTPAYAGNTVVIAYKCFFNQVHPRIRGEYSEQYIPLKDIPGSPPHTRGIRGSEKVIPHCLRFTPAYAGNTPDFEA